MAKYVCDYDQVTKIGENLCKSAEDVKTAVNTYSSSIESDLSSWTGVAKDSYSTTNNEQVQTTIKDAEYVNALGEFIKDASSQIQAKDEELAGLGI